MKAHISDAETKMNLAFETKLLQVRQAGLAAGTKAISGVIYKMATNENKGLEERINDIIKFCKIGLAIKDPTKEDLKKSDKDRRDSMLKDSVGGSQV